MKHLINKLTVDVGCSDEQEAFAMREHFLHELYEEMVSVIEMCCNRVSDDLQVIQLDKLEINLKTFKNKFIDTQEYIHLFGAAFEKELNKKLSGVAKRRTESQSRKDILSWFLLKGTLPWWAEKKKVDLVNWCNEIQEGKEQKNFILWLNTNKSNSQLWERMAGQSPARFKSFVIASIPELANAEAGILALYEKLVLQHRIALPIEHRLNELVRDFVLKRGDAILDETAPLEIEDFFIQFLSSVLSVEEIETLPQPVARAIIDIQAVLIEQGKSRRVDPAIDTLPDADQKIATSHAGIILIAAFLSEFYQRMTLRKDSSWVSDTACQKAVYLLYYLATGSQSPFEYELPFEKIVCGVPVGMPLNKEAVLTEDEKKEADELLRSVIQHWTALKNTSVDGLRQAFLQREGLLSLKNDNWVLEVERKTMDILLEQIPWGYATVALPWNRYLIFSEW